MSLRTIFILFLTCYSSHVVCAQESAMVTGQILSPAGEAIPGITIRIEQTGTGTASNANGKYQLTGLAPGAYRLVFSGVGLKEQVQEVTLTARQTLRLNVNMVEETTEMEELVVYGKSENAMLEEKGFAVDAIGTKDLELQSIQANELLDQTAGVRIRQDGGLGSRVRYNINGLSGNSIRIFLDGIPIENYGTSFSLSSIPASLIDRIEVYKGVVPAHLGDDALGGAINVISKKIGMNTLNASYSFGSFNTHQASVNGSYRNNRSGFTFRGSAFYNYSDNNYKVRGNQVYLTDKRGKISYVEAERFHDSYQSAGTKLDFGFTDVKWADQFFVGVVVSDMERDVQHGATMETVYGNRRASQSTQMVNSSYDKDNFLLKGLDLRLFGSYSQLKRHVVDTVPYIYDWSGKRADFNEDGKWDEWASGAEGGNPTLSEALEKKYTGRANVLYHLSRQNRIAVNYVVSDFSRRPDDPMRPQAERDLTDTRYMTKNIVGVAYEQEAFANRLKASLFFKYYRQSVRLKDPVREGRNGPLTAMEYNKQTGESGYGIALSYAIIPNLRLMASAENAIRLPESQEIFGNSAENIDPAYELQPERSMNINVGFNVGQLYFNKHSVKFIANVFYRDTRGMIRQAVANEQAETYAFENQDEVLSKGVDAELNYSYDDKFTLTSGMSIFNARFNKQYDAHGAEYIYYGDRLRNEPYFTLNNNFRYNISDFLQKESRLSLYYNLGYVHEFFRDWESLGRAGKAVIPSQLVNDLGVAYTFPDDKITLSFDAKNIFNEQVFDNWALQKPGRAFYAKFNYKIF